MFRIRTEVSTLYIEKCLWTLPGRRFSHRPTAFFSSYFIFSSSFSVSFCPSSCPFARLSLHIPSSRSLPFPLSHLPLYFSLFIHLVLLFSSYFLICSPSFTSSSFILSFSSYSSSPHTPSLPPCSFFLSHTLSSKSPLSLPFKVLTSAMCVLGLKGLTASWQPWTYKPTYKCVHCTRASCPDMHFPGKCRFHGYRRQLSVSIDLLRDWHMSLMPHWPQPLRKGSAVRCVRETALLALLTHGRLLRVCMRV
jgi:hypothetical protein